MVNIKEIINVTGQNFDSGHNFDSDSQKIIDKDLYINYSITSIKCILYNCLNCGANYIRVVGDVYMHGTKIIMPSDLYIQDGEGYSPVNNFGSCEEVIMQKVLG